MRLLIFFIVLALAPSVFAQQPDSTSAEAFRVYTGEGRSVTLAEVGMAMEEVDVVFVGEEHDDPIAHALELKLLQTAFVQATAASRKRPVALSLEMFDRDVQLVLDEYLAGLITEEHFRKSSRPWDNYETDYRPLVEFAKAHGLPVAAANTPRRYVNRVARLGPASLDSLSAQAKAVLPPLPFPEPSAENRDKWDRLMAAMMAEMPDHGASADSLAHTPPDSSAHGAGHASPHAGPMFLLEAQALWDAGMGYSIAEHLNRQPGSLVLHAVGGFHVEEGTGTPEALRHYRPGTRMLVVAIRPAEDIEAFDQEKHGKLGDFVILTDESLPRSYDAPSF